MATTNKKLKECKCGTKAYDQEDLELFVKSKRHKHGRNGTCKKCHNARAKSDKLAPLRNRKATCKRDYGITLEEYNICMSTSDKCEHCGVKDNLCYDHDHKTGKFRGVLCSKCNRHLGGLGDDIDSILNILKYLTR